jgi:FtsP/CotA-like multicopper oxidase with cupredoxin domain
MRRLGVLSLLVIAGCGTNGDADAGRARHVDGGQDEDPAKSRRPLAEIWGGPLLEDENPDPDIVEVKLRAGRARAVFDGKEIDVLAYNGTVPGPLLRARPGQRVIVHFENALEEPTTVHWHGLRIPDTMDGSPRIQNPVPPGGTFTYQFKVPEAASFWYHPHVSTHDQLERGLYGPIVIQDDRDPIYDLERYLVLDDVTLDAEGNIAPPRLDGLDGLTGRYGNLLLTNGKNAKTVRASAKKGQVERWRLLNTANARKMRLRIEGARWRLIATDGGLLEAPLEPKELTLAVGGRLDVEVSYDTAGSVALVHDDGTEQTTMFAVDVEDGPDAPRAIPWPEVKPYVPERTAKQDFEMSFDFVQKGTSAEWYVNGESHWMDPILTVPQGTTMRIRLVNAKGGVAHPFHLHGQFFRVDHPDWPGLRDTVQVPEHGPITIIAYFDNPGRWMAHCHILEHAELGFMTEIQVTSTGAPPPWLGGSEGGGGSGARGGGEHGH